MDLARPSRQKQRTRRRIAYAAGAAAVLALRSLVVIEPVRRGALLRQVRGTGSLVPVEVNWIAAATDARVVRVVTQPGTAVRPETLILALSDPAQVQRGADARDVLQAG